MEKHLRKITEPLTNMKKLNKTTKNMFLFLIVTTLFLNFGNAQKIDLGEYEMEIIEAFNRNSIGGSVFTGAKKKLVGIEVMLIPKSKKNSGVDLDDMELKSENDNYYLIYRRGMTVHLRKGQVIHQRRPKKVMIFAEVDKNLTNATFYYKEKAIISIEVEEGNKIGTYKILE